MQLHTAPCSSFRDMHLHKTWILVYAIETNFKTGQYEAELEWIQKQFLPQIQCGANGERRTGEKYTAWSGHGLQKNIALKYLHKDHTEW